MWLLSWQGLSSKSCCALQVVLKRHKHEQGKPWPAYTPCQCVGGCGANCPCLKSKNFCEKFCGCCPTKCGIRFQGCDCKSGCRSKTCPCFAAGTPLSFQAATIRCPI